MKFDMRIGVVTRLMTLNFNFAKDNFKRDNKHFVSF